MNYLMIIDNATGEAQMMALADAAFHTHMDTEDIERSIQNSGVCISIDHSIIDTEAADDVLVD
ncbi:hypothetical protein GOD80_15355 [Sinorhizobium medicae]|uniref:hypothetical protein n=1 Tax=Sinorhizobium medicae TaxID=110321 RepID=UPI0004034C71|nr:hypothetical protein [Sinorhizobium medicae]MDX0769584.1 hypothetical protein [Sinorhizobium medicae]MDX0806571.1 hypothetical protein [Sinorhizobium medicae]RVQ72879.1 hypothetical protein CN244_11765 [Sinorhizobium medicae]